VNLSFSSLHSIFQRPAVRIAGALFLVALFVRLAVLVALISYGGQQQLVLGDSTRYLTLAQHVVSGEGYTYDGFTEAYRPPGYPVYLMIFEALHLPLWFASFIQIVLGSLIPVAVLFFARRFLNLPLAVGAIAGVLSAIEPVQVFYNVTLMPDAFFTIAFLVGIYFLVRWSENNFLSYAIYAGLALGLSNYFRPAGIYIIAFLIFGMLAYLFVRKQLRVIHVAHLALLSLAFVAVIAPWCIRNYQRFGSASFVSSSAYGFYAYSAASAIAISEGRDYNEVKHELLAKLSREAPDGVHGTSLENSDYLMHETVSIIRQHPVAYFKAYALGVNTLFFSGNYHYLLARYGIIKPFDQSVSFTLVLARDGVGALIATIFSLATSPYLWVAIFGKLFWFVAVIASLVGAWLFRRSLFSTLYVATVVYFAATIAAMTIGVEARHRYALNPLIFLFSSAVVYLLYEKVIRRRSTV
jgi:hypothetical protein